MGNSTQPKSRIEAVGTTGLSVEPGGQRADGKARISSVQTVGTSICAGEEGLALEAAFIGGQLISCDLQLCERFAQWSAAKLHKISPPTRVNYARVVRA